MQQRATKKSVGILQHAEIYGEVKSVKNVPKKFTPKKLSAKNFGDQ
jgi:hypothetical protein